MEVLFINTDSVFNKEELSNSGIVNLKIKNPVVTYLYRYVALFTVTALSGAIALNVFGVDSVTEKIGKTDIFLGCVTFVDYVNAMLSFFSGDMIQMIILFALGFSVICSSGSSFLLILRGFSFGYSSAYLYLSVKLINGTNSVYPMVLIVLYAAISALLIVFAASNTVFSYEIRKSGILKKHLSSDGIVFRHIVRFSIIFGLMLILGITSGIITKFV